MAVAVLNPVSLKSVVETCESGVDCGSREVCVERIEPYERVQLDQELSLEVSAFVALVPQQFRLSLWARLTDTPTASRLLKEIELMGLCREVDPSYGFVRNGTEFLVTREVCPGWLPVGYLLDNGPGELSQCTAFLPVLREELPEGYCYLTCVVGGPPSVLGSVFGSFPKYAEVSPFLRVLARAEVVGQYAHLSTEGSSLLSDVAEPDTFLGGVRQDCRQGSIVSGDNKGSCPYCFVGPCDCVGDARGAGVSFEEPHVNIAFNGNGFSPDYVFSGQELHTGATLEPGLHTFPSSVQEFNGAIPYMWFAPYWTLWLSKGEAGTLGRYDFDGASAVWIVGRGACSFTPRALGRKLCVRVFSHYDYLKCVFGRFKTCDGHGTMNFSCEVGARVLVSLGGSHWDDVFYKNLPLFYDPGIDERDMSRCFQTQFRRLSCGNYSVDVGGYGCVLYSAKVKLSFGGLCVAPGERVHFVGSKRFDGGKFHHIFRLCDDGVVALCRVDEEDTAELLYAEQDYSKYDISG